MKNQYREVEIEATIQTTAKEKKDYGYCKKLRF